MPLTDDFPMRSTPHVFLGLGPSLLHFAQNVERFRGLGVRFVSLNRYRMAEQILDQIGQHLDVVVNFAKVNRAEDCEPRVVYERSEGIAAGGCSLEEWLWQCLGNYVPLVALFGCDGKASDRSQPYYERVAVEVAQGAHHWEDTEVFNNRFATAYRNGRIATRVLNCTAGSAYDLPFATVEEAVGELMAATNGKGAA